MPLKNVTKEITENINKNSCTTENYHWNVSLRRILLIKKSLKNITKISQKTVTKKITENDTNNKIETCN